ncbi:integrase catalytic domain-containing protein [Trichonephila clavata]|uniref:Integrase catalytic domain-containing protein n=1 Tax=Trichonephila clavata TaxID=2740835 RepID=A0A8X6G1M8_TRICU|nr:integrase catalytic domain-containing protein [Trichonephila clavata]
MDKNCLIQRKVLRSAVTKTISELDNCIAANDFPAASLAFTKLEEKTKRLFENDELVITYLSSHPDPDTDPDTIVENELEQNETYRDNFISAKVRFQEFSKIYEQKTQQLDISPSMDRLSINLPKLQLIDFDGNPKNWFSFWSMFQKIDEDPKIEDDVKFAYLMQTTKGKAFDFVQSYHVSKGEYKTVIKNLKTRFADDKMLIELYVRELLKLILNQSHNMSFTDLVDQLDTYLRCLENLGVTKEKYACMLYPLVEASIPEQILIAWERERNSISRNSTANTHDLDLLIQFLRSEVVSAERLRIAKAFCAGEKDKNRTSRQKTDPSGDLSSVTPVPTASSFVTQTKSERRESNIFCLFCSKKTHRSSDCFTAQKMPFQERKEKVLKMKACLSCLRINCRADRCGMSVRCIVYSKKHFPILCPNLCRENENSFSSPSKTEINSVTSNSSSGSTDVLLQTLRIRVSGPLKTKIVRCLCDSASQRSYINRDLAEFLDLKVDHPEFLKHSLFGGIETEKIKHFAFKCELQEIRGNFSCEAILLDKEVICGTIPKISKSDAECFTKNGIYLSDCEKNDSAISVLLGADYLGKILTGFISQQPNGLTAVQTYLGWVAMGKSLSYTTCSNHAMPVISLLNGSKICDLWSLDILGIRDPVENKTRKDIDDDTVSFFEKTVKFNQGRYEVNLPWVEGHPKLLDLLFQSEKRLNTMTSKLISTGKFDSYDKILKEWEQLGIIEPVPINIKGVNLSQQKCRYLPHRAVFKESSLTTKIRPVFDASAKDENSISLNQCLATGPNYIEMIPSILNKFRKNGLGVISDIRKAFAACVFLRIECDNKVKIKLVQAKSRVAPLKKDPITKTKNEMSIPKLELLAAVIGTRLVQSVKTSLNIHSIQTFYWTDSKVVLCWIKNSGTWKTFVRNRIKEIHSSSSKEDWYYVPSQMNAADIASRGCNAQTLFSLCWWRVQYG